MKYVELSNGVKMPMLGYGLFQIVDHDDCVRCVVDAIESGYRLLDTAQSYGNEKAVGEGIKKSGINREDLFITTKVWISNAGYEKAKLSITESLKNLQLDYIDLMLIHQPFGDYYGTYRAMEEFYKEGKIKAIGVSNFYPDRLVDLASFVEIPPMVNQVETHPFNQQIKAKEVMEKYNVQIEAWAPFAQGKGDIFNNKILKTISDFHKKSISQVILRFLIQSGVVVIPKTVSKARMDENFNVFDFSLGENDMAQIATLDKNESLFFNHDDVAVVERLVNYKN